MSYGVKYILNIKTLKERNLKIEILLNGYIGEYKELTGAPDAFQVHIDDEDFLYTPLRLSTAKLSIIGEDYLRELYSTSYQQWKIRAYRDDALVWSGFIKPEIYTQDFSSEVFELQIECISSISVLENIEYETIGETPSHTTLWMFLKRIVQKSKGDFNSVVIPNVYSKSKEDFLTSYNVFEELKINENNFFEDDKVSNWLEILEELCKVLNWTLNDWNGSLVFLDVDHKGTYRKYNQTLTRYEEITPQDILVQNTGYSGSDHSLDILGGYNKVTVEIKNNEVKHPISVGEYVDFVGQTGRGNDMSYYGERKSRTTMTRFYKENDQRFYHYINGETEITEERWIKEELWKVDFWTEHFVLGAFKARYFSFSSYTDDGLTSHSDTNTFNFQNAIVVYENAYKYVGIGLPGSWHKVYGLLKNKELFRIKSKELLFEKGWVSIDFTLIQLDKNRAISLEDQKNRYSQLIASLKVGNKYWNGKVWSTSFSYFNLPLEDNETGNQKVKANRDLRQQPYNAQGYIVDVESRGDYMQGIGDLEFCLYSTGVDNSGGYILENFSISYEQETVQDSFEKDEQDRIYTNVVNEGFINELDNIEMKISTHNKDGICLSKLVLNNEYLKDNLYCSLLDEDVRLEELLIRRIRGQYARPKYKLSEELNFIDLPLLPVLSDKNMVNSRFIIGGGSLNYTMDSMELDLIENDRQESSDIK